MFVRTFAIHLLYTLTCTIGVPESGSAPGGCATSRTDPAATGRGTTARSAGKWLEYVAEVPGVLRDTRTGIAVGGAGTAAVVTLDRPDRQEVHPVGLGEHR